MNEQALEAAAKAAYLNEHNNDAPLLWEKLSAEERRYWLENSEAAIAAYHDAEVARLTAVVAGLRHDLAGAVNENVLRGSAVSAYHDKVLSLEKEMRGHMKDCLEYCAANADLRAKLEAAIASLEEAKIHVQAVDEENHNLMQQLRGPVVESPVRDLGAVLAMMLDEDQWPKVEPLLLSANSKLEAAERDAAKKDKAIQAVCDLMNNSFGVAGLHLNGDIAPWDELKTGGRFERWLVEFDDAARKEG